MNPRIKVHLMIVLVLMEVAVIGLGRPSSQGSAISLSEFHNILTGSANRIGARFPSGTMYDLQGKIRPLYRRGRLTFIVFVGCDCSITRSNEWARAARLHGEDTVQVFPGSPANLRSTARQHVIEGRVATCAVEEAFAIVGKEDMARLPVGYHIERDGTLISKQR